MNVSENRHLSHPKVRREQAMWVLHRKSLGSADGAQKLILMGNSIEEENPIKLKNWTSRTISGCLE